MPSWSTSLATGDAKIDEQHREIFRRYDALQAAIRRGDRGEALRLLEFLGSYVGEHFAAEERAMKASLYPAVGEHRSAHARFVRGYLAVGKDLESRGPSASVTVDLERWLASWLNAHILDADVKLARHLLEANFVLEDVG